MYITNLWGVTFLFLMPTALLILGAYIAGKEEGRIEYAKSQNRHRVRKTTAKIRGRKV